jgi:hypothetical protein
MASVHLDFVPPNQPNLETLKIWESTSVDGIFGVIESVTPVGTYPNYLSEYTTDQATSPDNWFAISWVDDKGAETEKSAPIQGGASTLVRRLADRVLLRDATLNELVVVQTSEWAITYALDVSDPYSIADDGATYQELEGMTFLVMAHSLITTIAATSATAGESYTAGLISQKGATTSTASTDKTKLAQSLLDLANSLLGKNYTVVMLLEEIDPIGTGVTGFDLDQSRLLLTEKL